MTEGRQGFPQTPIAMPTDYFVRGKVVCFVVRVVAMEMVRLTQTVDGCVAESCLYKYLMIYDYTVFESLLFLSQSGGGYSLFLDSWTVLPSMAAV